MMKRDKNKCANCEHWMDTRTTEIEVVTFVAVCKLLRDRGEDHYITTIAGHCIDYTPRRTFSNVIVETPMGETDAKL